VLQANQIICVCNSIEIEHVHIFSVHLDMFERFSICFLFAFFVSYNGCYQTTACILAQENKINVGLCLYCLFIYFYRSSYKGIEFLVSDGIRILSGAFMSLLIYEIFCSISRHVEKITGDIYLISRGLFFSHNAEIGRKGRKSTGSFMLKGKTVRIRHKPVLAVCGGCSN